MSSIRQRFMLAAGITFACGLQAQVDTPEYRWSLGASMWCGGSYRTLINTNGSETAAGIIRTRDDREGPDVAFGGGAYAAYRLSERFGLEAGMAYARFGYTYGVDASELTFGDAIDPRRGFIYSTNAVLPASWRLVDRFHYIEVPIGLVMELGHGRWRSSTALGVAPSALLSARGFTVNTNADGSEQREHYDLPGDFSSFNLIPYFSTGITMRTAGRWQWSLRPTVRYGALRVIDAPVSARLYSVSLDLGVRIAL